MSGVLSWIVFGFIVGAIAKLLTPGRDPGGFVVTILVGILGSLFGGYLGRALGWYSANQSAGVVMSIVGAIILLAVFHLFFRRRVVWRPRL
jgi:uncharacterized membrane protein YeaQ/YmgE (transglycosylase-associated protein family)